MRFITLFVVVIIYSINSDAFTLGPVKIHPPIKQNYYFMVSTQTKPEQIAVTLEKNGFDALNGDHLNQISREITLSIGISTTVQSMRWEFEIVGNIGTLNVVKINAEITESKVHITGGVIRLEQQIPIMYKTEERCARTGPRRYGVAGPRSLECDYHNIPRGLTGDEITKVNEALTSKVFGALQTLG
jgi:hypothetical protein